MEMKLKTIESEKYNVLRKATHESRIKEISDHISQMALESFCIFLKTRKGANITISPVPSIMHDIVGKQVGIKEGKNYESENSNKKTEQRAK